MIESITNEWALPRPEDELPHAVPDASIDLPYKDTWWFSFHDDDADLTAAVHLTLSANRRPGLRATIAFRHGTDWMSETVYTTPDVTAETVGCAMAQVRVVDPAWTPAKHLVLTVRHPDLEADLEIRGRYYAPLVSVLAPGLMPSGEGLQHFCHAEQGLIAAGEVRWGEQTFEVGARGYRDRSWGFRKSDKMALNGTTFGMLHLPDATCGLLAWNSADITGSDAMPVGAWLADDAGVVPAVGGLYHRSPEGWPARVGLELADGRVVDLDAARPVADLPYAFHEPEFDGPAIGTHGWDMHTAFDSSQGPATGVFNHAVPFMADVLRHSRFCFPDPGSTGMRPDA